jgi:hypothetical protein
MKSHMTTEWPDVWMKPVRRVQRMVSLGWFWVLFSRCLWVTAALTGFLWWLLRAQKVNPAPAWVLGGGALFAAVLAALDWSRQRRMTASEALVRLDLGWSLRQRLVSAAEGRMPWPAEVPAQPVPLAWQWRPCFPPLGMSLLFLLMAAWLPLPPQRPAPFRADTEPPDWTSLESMASFLEEKDLVREQDTERIRQDVEQLREKPSEDWYSPGSLEATDLLRERVQADVQRLREGMSRTANLVAVAAERREQLNQQQLQQLQDRLQEMQRRMQAGGMQPGEDLQQMLEQLNRDGLPQMDQQALENLRQQLEQRAEELRRAMAQAGMEGMDGEEGMPGGVGRGGDPSELGLQDFESHEQPAVPMPLPETRPERLQVGDLLEIREGEHDNDRPEISGSAGRLDSPGGGGEIIWRDDLLPEDAEVLRDYFQ